MPVFSYLAYPKPGQGRPLADRLRSLPGCEVVPSGGFELLILLTDTADDPSEELLQEQLENLEDLESLAMVYGHGSEELPEGQP